MNSSTFLHSSRYLSYSCSSLNNTLLFLVVQISYCSSFSQLGMLVVLKYFILFPVCF